MTLEWKPFKIDLWEFKIWLDSNISSSDGISASELNFEVVEKISFTQEDNDNILNYYNNLVEKVDENG